MHNSTTISCIVTLNMANRAVPLNTIGSKPIPVIGMGTAAYPWGSHPEATRSSVLRAIELGYRHFDTASLYQTEEPLGQAIAEALCSGLIKSRDELFITSKLWFTDAHKDLVLPALQKSLQKLQLEYLDLYLVHVPIGLKKKQETTDNMAQETVQLCPIDISSVWMAMEECHALGLTKSIGVSNFSCKKLETLLSIAKVPPAVNQVEVNPVWQQKKLREFCLGKGIQVCAYSPLGGKGAFWGQDWVMESHVLKEIAVERGKTIAQICLRWVIEQGDCVVVKSYNEKRMLENLDIFDWELSEEDKQKISQIPQRKILTGMRLVSDDGPYKSLEELWDGEI